MNVLQIVSAPRPFFDVQVDCLEAFGVDCTTVSVPGRRGRGVFEYGRFYTELWNTVTRDDFDLVHAHYGMMIPFALAQPKRPVVTTLWGSDVMSDIDWLVELTERTAPRCNAVIAPSTALSEQYAGEDVVIPFGVDVEQFRPMDRETARTRVGWPTDELTVLFPYDASRPVKNFELAKEVVANVDAPVTLRTLSGVAYDEMPTYYNASDAVLITSHYEAGPMVIKEAAACNVPVVSTDVGFASEVLDGVRNATVCDDAEELVSSLEAVLRSDRRSNARETLGDEICPEWSARRLVDVYREVLDGDV